MIRDVTDHTTCRVRLWDRSGLADVMSYPTDSLLDDDKIKELSLLIAKCGVNESRGLVDPLFELVGVTTCVHTSFI